MSIMPEQEFVEKNAIEERKKNLPATIEELIEHVIVGNEAIQSFKAKLRACDKCEKAKILRNQALNDGRKVSRLVIDAEIRLGELLEQQPNQQPIRTTEGSFKGTLGKLPIGINKKESHFAQEIYRNQDVIDAVFETKKNEIPTRHDVWLRIKEKKRRLKRGENEKIASSIDFSEIHIDFQCADFITKSKEIPQNSIGAIITDPPYGKEFLYLYRELSKMASRVLKPNGFCIVYANQTYLPEVIKQMNEYLNYYWMCSLLYGNGGKNKLVFQRNIKQGWKPILIYQKKIKKNENFVYDVIQGGGREKEYHPWQQAENDLNSLIEGFTRPEEKILDPMAGTGTTLICAKKLKRIPMGYEVNKNTWETAVGRIKKRFNNN